jgi:pimeloyl-ACP methyl ester carboxylesterase
MLVGLIWLLGKLPQGAGLALARPLGWMLYRLLGRRRHIARRNIERCFPDLGADEHESLVREHFEALGRMVFEICFAWNAPRQRFDRMARSEGAENLERARAKGRGILLLTMHSTCLEIGGRIASELVPEIRGVYRPLEDHLTMVYFDPRGMGGSGPIREEADMGLEAVRADFDALRTHLGLEKVHAIGWSNGAMNLLLLAAERPATIDAAIFLHGTAAYTADDRVQFAENYPEVMQGFVAMQQELQNPDMTDEQKTARMHQGWIEVFFPAACADSEAMMPVLREVFLVDSFSWRHSDYSQREAPGFDARDRLGEITARSLIVVGAHDTIPPYKGEEMRDGIAGSELVVFENSGHFSTLEEPERLVRVVVDFLAKE